MKVSDTDIELWTVDIAGRPAMVFGAVSMADAIAKVSAKSAIRNDLAIFKDSRGRPIWNGVDPLSVRESTPSEFRRWHETYADAHESATVGALDAPVENWIAFLIKVRDQTNDK